jgi:FkbM family methyltransferase
VSIKGRVVKTLSEIGIAAPWRSAVEKALVSLGHKYPTSRSVLSFCRHFGSKLIECEGNEFARVAIFETGGKMSCGGERKLAELSLFYYFCGTITGQYEDELRVVRLLRRLVKRGDVFFDLGANFGFYSCFVLPLCGRSGAVHAFEANPCLIPHLRRSIDLNREYGNIDLNPVAVGSNSAVYLPLYGTDRIGSSSLYPHEWLDRDSAIEVPVVTIDEYVREKRIKRIDGMKIDIEGAELDALHGMEETFRTCPPRAIICELTVLPEESSPERDHPEIRQRASSAADPYQLADFLRHKGYQLCYISDDGRLGAAPALKPTDDFALKVTNVAFVLPELQRLRPEIFVSQ